VGKDSEKEAFVCMSDMQILIARITWSSHLLCLVSFWVVNKVVLSVAFLSRVLVIASGGGEGVLLVFSF